MKTFFVTINERSGEYEYTDTWLVEAENSEHADEQIHQIMLTYRGDADFDPDRQEYEYAEHISYVHSVREVPPEHAQVLKEYLVTL